MPTAVDIPQFALNPEYLEAEFYTVATMGKTIDQVGIGIMGAGKYGPTTGGHQVNFANSSVFTRAIANQIGNDERNHVTQTDQLICDARTAQPPRIPLYCLYTHWQHREFGRRHPTAGCMLLSPLVVKKYRPGKVDVLKQLIDHMMPWHCMVCCPLAQKLDFARSVALMAKQVVVGPLSYPAFGQTGESPGDFAGTAVALGQEASQDPDARSIWAIEPGTQIPDYVLQIAEGGSPTVEDPELRFVTVFAQRPAL